MHAVMLCQLSEPVDYENVFSIVKSGGGRLTERLFKHIWDMTIIEYIICIQYTTTVMYTIVYLILSGVHEDS